MVVLLRRKKKPKAKFDPKDHSTWDPLLKVLAKWRLRGRTGLTVHALATLLDRPPEEVLKELTKRKKYTYGQYCNAVQAIVWSVVVYKDNGRVGLREPHPFSPHADSVKRAKDEVAKWPWPTARGVYHGKPLPNTGIADGEKMLQKLAEDGSFTATKREMEYL